MSATDSEIKKAVDIAQAQEFISGKEDGFDTVVAERGMKPFRWAEAEVINCKGSC